MAASLVPSFRDFLPPWLARQPWYRGVGTPSLALVGAFRFEDPAGQVGIETHLVTDGTAVYQLPMTYRGSPRPELPAEALIATAQHSELGPRWIYDGTFDPAWRSELLHLVRTNGSAGPTATRGPDAAQARGHLLNPTAWPADQPHERPTKPSDERPDERPAPATLAAWANWLDEPDDRVTIDLRRTVVAEQAGDRLGAIGLVIGTWQPDGPESPATAGCLAVIRPSGA